MKTLWFTVISAACTEALKLQLVDNKVYLDKNIQEQCARNQRRLENGPADFAEILKSGQLYTDTDFSKDEALYGQDGAKGHPHRQDDMLKWERVSELYPSDKGYSLWGKQGV